MQRFLTFVVLFFLTIPVGLSIQGCANKNSDYCNGSGYGYLKDQPVSISLRPQTTGLSVAFSQTSQLQAPAALNCRRAAASSAYTYGTTDRTIADVSPTGAVCGGTWNLTHPGGGCLHHLHPHQQDRRRVYDGSAAGFTSNQVAVYSHPPITSLSVRARQMRPPARPGCLSQGLTSQLDATAYNTNSAGQQVLLCSPNILPEAGMAQQIATM